MIAIMNTLDFSQWVMAELEARRWTQKDLAKRGGFSPGALNKVIKGERGVGLELALGIARAFRADPLEVLKRAGLIEGDVTQSDVEKRAALIIRGLSPSAKEEALRFLEYLDQSSSDAERKPRSATKTLGRSGGNA